MGKKLGETKDGWKIVSAGTEEIDKYPEERDLLLRIFGFDYPEDVFVSDPSTVGDFRSYFEEHDNTLEKISQAVGFSVAKDDYLHDVCRTMKFGRI